MKSIISALIFLVSLNSWAASLDEISGDLNQLKGLAKKSQGQMCIVNLDIDGLDTEVSYSCDEGSPMVEIAAFDENYSYEVETFVLLKVNRLMSEAGYKYVSKGVMKGSYIFIKY